MKLIPIFSLFLLLTGHQSVWSQQVYRCGNTYSQTPCSNEAKSIDLELASPPDCRSYSHSNTDYCTRKNDKQTATRAAKRLAEEEEKKALELKQAKEYEAKLAEAEALKKSAETLPMKVCRATIAALMGRPIDIVDVTKEQDGVVYTKYVRPNDESTWSHRCRVSGSSVFWATETGRWRTAVDETITYRLDGDEIVIQQRFLDGSRNEKRFTP